jgi:hypothetical protein
VQKTQLDACSGGKLTIMPATGTDITDGVMEVVLPERVVNGTNCVTVEDWVDDAVEAKVSGSLSQWDHLMYVLPDSVDFDGAVAYAYVNSYKSVFKGGYASYMGVQIHELGHNYNMRHSGFGTETYEDHTGLMGTFLSVNLEKELIFFLEQTLTLDPLSICR